MGQRVECRDDPIINHYTNEEGEEVMELFENDWAPGVVTSTAPLQVRRDGWDDAYAWDQIRPFALSSERDLNASGLPSNQTQEKEGSTAGRKANNPAIDADARLDTESERLCDLKGADKEVNPMTPWRHLLNYVV